MPKRINGIKDIVWAVGILAALIALLVGFFYGALGRWYGDKSRPVMDIGGAHAESGSAEKAGAGLGTVADGTLHVLQESGDAGQSYLDSLCFLVDGCFSGLRDSALTAGQVWTGENGRLGMADYSTWRVVYPGDGSAVTVPNAAMVAKPGLLVIALGSEGLAGISQELFTRCFEEMIAGILSASPQTKIVIGPATGVTAAYVSDDGMSAEKAAEVNGWLQQICTDTGAVWADWSSVLTDGGYLRPELAEGDGHTLNSAGLSAVCGWLRTHATA